MIYVYENSMKNGQSFANWSDVEAYFHELAGEKLSNLTRFQMKRGLSFKIGPVYFQCIAESAHVLSHAA